ncbi:hypothetical protein [Fuchsiella alkaliacetigena]|uniref:hypothetical protein n=1 Tax=Fuchsiella alkaliacetigena TaxID=957042 RepID=UPI00200A10DD|nr:hypothetical protein [Fuchsiella alkaliacetigena]MCK8826068.1 hypothetical protein [Fuchsiella alkaliacetigena]
MAKNKCSKCKGELTKISHITNIHITGDDKNISLYSCTNCNNGTLFVSMYANVGYGENYFKFRIDLTESEAGEIKEKMENCPEPKNEECNCPAHDFLDEFEINNKDRRVILADEKDRWVYNNKNN